MRRPWRRYACLSAAFLLLFLVWTALVLTVDVRPIGPLGTSVGLATLNGAVHRALGVRLSLYTVTDWLGLVPVAVALFFALLGLSEWGHRRRLCRVDASLFVLGGFYLAVIASYLFFEAVPLNYRPVLLGAAPEGSYPSSTTLLAVTVLPTAMMEMRARLPRGRGRRALLLALAALLSFMVIGRVLSGVHWPSDIVGALLLGASLDLGYAALSALVRRPR